MGEMVEYSTFKNFAVSESFRGSNVYVKICSSIDRYISEDEIKFFYPQNLFVEPKPLIMFVFKADDFWVLGYNDNDIQITVHKYKSIESLVLNETTSYNSVHTLAIGLSSGERFVLNGYEDTNSHHAHRYDENVMLIFKHITKHK